MFRGINALTLDLKGRFSVPSKYRDGLGLSVVVTIDTETQCLLLYPLAVWLDIEKKIQQLPGLNPAARRLQRLLIGHATDIEVDGSGRLLLPPLLLDYAKLEKGAQLMLVGQGHKFEIWQDELWRANRDQWLLEHASLSDLSDEVKTLYL